MRAGHGQLPVLVPVGREEDAVPGLLHIVPCVGLVQAEGWSSPRSGCLVSSLVWPCRRIPVGLGVSAVV